jgi:hypothetical protein
MPIVYSQDWSAGNSLFTSMNVFERDVEGADPLYPEIHVAEGCTISGGKVVWNGTHGNHQTTGLTMRGFPTFDGSEGSITATYTPNADCLPGGSDELSYVPLIFVMNTEFVETFWLEIYETGGDWFYSLGRRIFGGFTNDYVDVEVTTPFVADTPYTFKVAWKCGTPSGGPPYTSVAADGYLRFYVNDVLVGEFTDVGIWIDENTNNEVYHVFFATDYYGSGGGLFGALGDIEFFSGPEEAELEGYTYLWTQLSGPGTATFSDATILDPTVTFDEAGVYYLRLTVTHTETEWTGYDDVVITVTGNLAPVVNAGANQTLSIGDLDTTLTGTATDDGLPDPPAALTYLWTQIAGPYPGSNATFGTPTALTTTVTLPIAGNYVFRLTVSDGELTGYDDVTIIAQQAIPVSDSHYVIKINGVDKTDRLTLENVRIEYPINNQGSLECAIIDIGAPASAYRPDVEDVVEVWLDTHIPPWAEEPEETVKVFMGKILTVDETPIEDNEGTRNRLTCVDYFRALASRLFTGDFGRFRTVISTPATRSTLTLRFTNDNTEILLETREGGSSIDGVYNIEIFDPGVPDNPLTIEYPATGHHVIRLETDSGGEIVTTANELRDLIHPAENSILYADNAPGSDGTGIVAAKDLQWLTGAEDGTYEVVYDLKLISVYGNPAQVITDNAHSLVTGDAIKFKNVTGTTPDLNDEVYEVTVVGPAQFTVPENVTVSGTGNIIKMVRLNTVIEGLAPYLLPYGISLAPMTLPTPWVEAKYYENRFIGDIVADLMKEVAWVSRITPNKIWEVFEPGTIVSTIELREDNYNLLWTPSLTRSQDNYINQVIVYYGPSEQRIIKDRFIADGATSSWTLKTEFIVTYGYVQINDTNTYLPLGIYGLDVTLEWLFDWENWIVYHNDALFGVVPAGTTITVPYRGVGQSWVQVPDPSPVGEIYEESIQRDDLLTEEAAITAGEALLVQRATTIRTLRNSTMSQFVQPGTAIPVDIPKRLVSGTWAVVNTEISELADTRRAVFNYELIEAGALENYVDFWRLRFGQEVR